MQSQRRSTPRSPRLSLTILALAGACVLAVASCGTHEDNTVGSRLIEDQATRKAVREIVLSPPDSSADFQLTQPSGNAGSSVTILLGARPGHVSRSLCRFDLSGFTGTSADVDSAFVRSQLADTVGDPATLAVAIHRLTADWEEYVTSFDGLSWLAASDTVSLNVTEVTDSSSVPLTGLVRFWLDQPDSNFGFGLFPIDGVDALQEYTSDESGVPPQLIVYWRNADVPDSTSFDPTQDTFILETTPDFVPLTPIPGDPGRLTVARGIPARAFLAFTLPDLGERATINRAQLTVWPDHSLSQLNSLSLGVSRIREAEWAGADTYVDGVIFGAAEATADSASLVFEIALLVEEIYLDGVNHGFQVRAINELVDIDYLRFHSEASADTARRPELRIFYTPGDDPEVQP